jgi:hypothetical protein
MKRTSMIPFGLAVLAGTAAAQGPGLWNPPAASAVFDAGLAPFLPLGTCIQQVSPFHLAGDAPGTYTVCLTVCRLSAAYGGSGRRYGVVMGTYDPAAGTFTPNMEAAALNGPSTVQSYALSIEPGLGRYAVFDRLDGAGNLLGPYFAARTAAGQPFTAPVQILGVPGLSNLSLAGFDPAIGYVGGTLMLFFNYWQGTQQHIAMMPLDLSNPAAPVVTGNPTIVVDAGVRQRVHSSHVLVGPDGDVEGLYHAWREGQKSDMCVSADLDPATPPEIAMTIGPTPNGDFLNNGGIAGGRFVAAWNPGGYIRAVDARGAWLIGDVEAPGGMVDLAVGADVRDGPIGAQVFVWLGLPRSPMPTGLSFVSGELGIAIVMDIGLLTVDAWGLGSQSFRAPSDPVFAGQTFAIQGVSVDRNGPVHLTLTNRAAIRL